MVAIKADLFMDLKEFRDRMQVLYDKVHDSSKMAGVDRIYLPGEMEQLTEQQRKRDGIPFKLGEIDSLNTEARRASSQELPLG